MQVYQLNLPDRSQYTEFNFFDNLVGDEFLSEIKTCKIIATSDTRLLFSSHSYLKIVTDLLKKSMIDYSVKETSFFDLRLPGLSKFQDKIDGKLDFVVKELDKTENSDIFKHFMLDSFGVDFNTDNSKNIVTDNTYKVDSINYKFQAAIADPKNRSYLVTDKSEAWVGAFTLVFLPNLRQIQLHSVAGRNIHDNVYSGGRKIEIISAKVVEVLEQYRYDFNHLIFSCSKPKVKDMYLAFGFEINSEIKCVVV